MKKMLCFILSAVMLMSMSVSAFAATPEVGMEVASEQSEAQARGALHGVDSANTDGRTSGSFTVKVTGISWSSAQVQISITGFNSGDIIDAKVFRPDRSELFHVAGWTGDTLSTDKRSTNWITVPNVPTGTYTVEYSVGNWYGNTPGSGTVKCEIK